MRLFEICSYRYFKTVKTRVFPLINDNSRLEDNSEKALRQALGNILSLKLCIFIDLLPLNVKKSGAKNCYSISGIVCTSRFIDSTESCWQSRDARQHASQQASHYMAVSVKSFGQKNLAH